MAQKPTSVTEAGPTSRATVGPHLKVRGDQAVQNRDLEEDRMLVAHREGLAQNLKEGRAVVARPVPQNRDRRGRTLAVLSPVLVVALMG